MGRNFTELRDDAVNAFEEMTGELPNDYETAVISAGAREMTEGDDGSD